MVLAHNINEGLRTQDVQISEDVTFETMLLSPNTLDGLTNCGFYKPSPIQLHAIPLGKCGFDLILEAKSGTGKTAVFTVIALEKLDLKKGLQTIILAPTREIASQISNVITQIGSHYKNLNVEVVIGGLPVHEDIAKLKNKVHVVVGSPGRLRHLIQANHMDISAVRLLVLDEADKLMDKNFQADINYIFSVLPKEKQVIMSSATYPQVLKSVMTKYVQNAQHICPDSTTVLIGIKQLILTVKSNSNIVRQTKNRFDELLKILSKKNFKQCLIFCNYQVRVRGLCQMLLREKWPAEKLHGQQEQTDRLDALKMLQDYKCRILISTDLAARGIDASNVDLVINFEPPYDWQTYLHRIGRAGRFGSYGTAVTILSEGQEESTFKKMIRSINGLVFKNFWDEENVDLDNCDDCIDTLCYKGIEKNEVCAKVIDKLTNRKSKNDEETESFEALCKSFQETKEIEIESFDDLLTCFKSHKESLTQDNNNECALNLSMQTKESLNLNTNENIESIDIKHSKNQNVKECTKETCKTNIKHEAPLETHSDAPDKLLHTHELSDLEYNESLKPLLEAGLPTSFQSRKYKTKKSHPPQHHNYGYEIENTSQKHTTNKATKVVNKKRTTRKQRKTSISQEADKCLAGRELVTSCREKHRKVSFKSTSSNETIDNEIENQYSCDAKNVSPLYNQEIDQFANLRYVNWYKNLKMHVEQVRMSLYIEELSKV
ncbi:hypothetical protein B5X24_HaOG207850 [Helicoverpa armigera]|uniref:RNA helicase n=1 Tax=Helicoverpa armigera TaxID=29058 RepID=A0A2W1BME5_HELAM|nr:hypothetical protein B5X24_HaOG207850 [Helicoverpa armigera]